MPRPSCETWFMEGTLIPNYHYIEIKPDFSDLEERLQYYMAHTDEAQAIIEHAHEYIEQFKNKKREQLISLLVLEKYYKKNKQQAIKIWEWSEEQCDQIIKTNLRIPFLVTKNVVPVMIKQGKGDIVFVSSRMGRIASQMGAYAVAKGGIVTMTKTTAIQTKEYGIKCNAVSPGIVDTPGQRVYNHSVGQDGCPMGSSKDVAKAIIYLLADSPAVMTGQSIDLFTTV